MSSYKIPTTSRNRSAVVIPFPLERRLAIRIEREADGLGWFVLTYDREYGSVCGSFDAAICEACSLATGYGVNVVSSAGVLSC
jgi:hypothetical protein